MKGDKYVACDICESCNLTTKMHTHEGKTFCPRDFGFLKKHLDAGKSFDEAMDLASKDYAENLRLRTEAYYKRQG